MPRLLPHECCLYGRVLEPDLVQLARPIKRGALEGLRGLSLATNLTRHWRLTPDATDRSFPANRTADREAGVRVQPGSLLPIRLLQIGPDAQQLREAVIELLHQRGQSQGLGPNSAKFQIDLTSAADRWQRLEMTSLPLRPLDGVLPRVRIHLVSPLFLKARKHPPRDRQQGRRRLSPDCLGRPSFLALFRESLRTVRRAVNEYAASDWSDGADMRFLIESAERVKVIDSNMLPYRQSRTSARQVSRWMLSGWSGSITVVDVPLHLMPYLYWAGQIGVGDGRNCGAGLWEIEL